MIEIEALIDSARAGDKQAVESLICRYEESVRTYAARLCPGQDTADDIAQDALLAALQNLDEFDPARDFGLWVCGIVRNLARREWHRIAREKSKVEALTLHVELLAEEQQESAGSGEELAALRHCLKKLPSKSSRLFHMFYELGFKHSQIAAHIRTSSNAVKQAMKRLREKVRKCVERELVQTRRCNDVG